MTDHTTPPTPDDPDNADDAAVDGTDNADTTGARPRGAGRGREITLSVRGLLGAALITALVVTAGVFIYRDIGARDLLDRSRADASDRAKAESVAGGYATGAATLDYTDLNPWIANVKRGVSPELQKQYDVVGQAMGQIMGPLRMQMSSELVIAKTTRVVGSMYEVQAVVDTNIKSAQAPNGAGSTAVYSLTLDKSKNWEIQKVGDPTKVIADNVAPPAPGAGPAVPAPSGAPPASPAG
ncbi:hypothetical protein [Williamsia sp.]|uniref:hypothetical protein n=1 Tax=Williamsia sp. TaxID=1872085 RepID=UPI001A2DF333|nr:hypothetical protein [Williamsia sp.]MBJ7291064.1 hypothetical protein [Williamsia sp.]